VTSVVIRRVIEWAHERDIPATSHYHYPAFAEMSAE
jgi:hypothetical protein